MASSSSSSPMVGPVAGSRVPPFERGKLRERLAAVTDRFGTDLAATPGMSEQNIQALYVDGPGGSLLTALGWPVDAPTLYRQNVNLTASLRPDGLLARPALAASSSPAPVNLIAVDVKKPDQLPRFEPGERLNLDKLRAGGSNLFNKIRYCDYGPGAPRWLLLSCTDRLYLYDSLAKRWVIALNSASAMLSEEGLDRLAMLSWPALTVENANELKGLARRYERKSLEEQLEDELRGWRMGLAEMLYWRNHTRPILANPDTGQFDPTRLQRAVQRVLDRLLLVQILQDKGFVNDLVLNDLDVLQNVLAVRDSFSGLAGLTLQMLPLYDLLRKGVFDQFANRYGSAIFEPHLCDELDYGTPGSPEEDVLASVMKGIMQFSFREFDSRRLGTVYERYAGFRIDFEIGPDGVVRPTTREDMRFRKQSGTYYTPDYIVEYIVRQTLGQALAEGTPAGIAGLKVLDPACGSGTFLIGAFETLAEFYHGWYERWLGAGLNGVAALPPDMELTSLGELVAHYPRRILERHLYGVDLNPEAAEFATVSLLLTALEWEKDHDLLPVPGQILPAGTPSVEPLPLILNQNIKVGNSLISGLPRLDDRAALSATLAPWRPEIELILGRRQTLCERADLDRADRLRLLDEIAALAERVNYGSVAPGRLGSEALPPGPARPGLNGSLATHFGGDLDGVRDKNPFNWPVEFPEVFPALFAADPPNDESQPAPDGFDCVIGNPPYIRIQFMPQDEIKYYDAIYKSAEGNYDIYNLFVEKGLTDLCKKDLGYILPHKFFQASYGAGLRTLIGTKKALKEIINFGHLQIFEQAATYTCLLFLSASKQTNFYYASVKNLENRQVIFNQFASHLAFKDNNAETFSLATSEATGKPWTFISISQVDITSKILAKASNLQTITGRIFQGIRTSANEVYVLKVVGEENNLVRVFSQATQTNHLIESALLKPFLRGEDVKRYNLANSDQMVLIPYKLVDGKATLILEEEFTHQYPHTWTYLKTNETLLRKREDGKMDKEGWWAYVYPKNLNQFGNPKIIVPDIAFNTSGGLDERGNFCIVSGYGITISKDGYAPASVLAQLNSKIAWFFLKRVSTPLRGGFYRYFTQFIEQIPVYNFEFTTDPHEREARVAAAGAMYKDEPGGLVRLVAAELAAGRADVVHDVLAMLAEEMTELTRQRRGLITQFDRWVEGYERKPSLGLRINGLPPGRLKVLPGIAQKKGIELRRLEARPATALQAGPGEAALSVWLTYRQPGSKTDITEEIYRAVLPTLQAEFVRYSLPKEGGFKTDKKRESWLLANDSVSLRDVPGSALPAILDNYRATLAEAARLDQRLTATDATIDAIVYDLYGLDAAERAIIEGK